MFWSPMNLLFPSELYTNYKNGLVDCSLLKGVQIVEYKKSVKQLQETRFGLWVE